MFRYTLSITLSLALVTSGLVAVAAEGDTGQGLQVWPQFRGPQSLGTAEGANLPDTWNETENIAWKTDIPGMGWSSPVVWMDKVFLTTVVNQGDTEAPTKGLYFGGNRTKPPETVHEWKVYCVELASGKILWDRVAHSGVPQSSRHLKNSFASETPITDGQRVYAYFGNQGVYCYDMDGELLWSHLMDPVKMRFGWGTAASPVLHGDRLFIVNDNDEQSFMIALDAKTGQEVMRVERDEKSNWATPYIWENELRTEIVTPGTGKVRSYDLKGNLLWELSGMSSITIATPFSKFGLLYISSGYVMDKKKPIYAIKPGASGDISLDEEETSNDYIAWCQKQAGPYNPSPLIYGDRIYVLLDRGFFACYDAKTGEQIYDRQRLPGGKSFTVSPWAADGKIFCLSEYGETFVIKPGDEFEILHTNTLGVDDMWMSTPALVENKLLLRSDKRLYCIEKGK